MSDRAGVSEPVVVYKDSSNVPRIGDRIYAGDEYRTVEFITVVREVRGEYLTTAGWPEQRFPVRYCSLVERGEL